MTPSIPQVSITISTNIQTSALSSNSKMEDSLPGFQWVLFQIKQWRTKAALSALWLRRRPTNSAKASVQWLTTSSSSFSATLSCGWSREKWSSSRTSASLPVTLTRMVTSTPFWTEWALRERWSTRTLRSLRCSLSD